MLALLKYTLFGAYLNFADPKEEVSARLSPVTHDKEQFAQAKESWCCSEGMLED